jgi:cytoskeletal protein CcmA (bactofilin family)
MKTITIGLALVLVLSTVPAQLDTRLGEDIRITTPVDDDLYLIGKNVVIDAPVRGDVVVVGGTVTINDTVTMDVLAAGGRVEINGYVGDDIRVAGGSIKVSSFIKGDILAAGGEIILPTATILDGNLTASGGAVDIAGDVNGNVSVFGEELDLSGSTGGSLEAKGDVLNINGTVTGPASIAANKITIGSGAKFSDNIRFWNNEETLAIGDDNHTGTVTFDPSLEMPEPRPELLGFTSVLLMLWYLGTALIVIWLIEYLFSKTFLKAAGIVLDQSLKSLGFGVLYFIAVPTICLVLAITVLALPIGIIALIGYIILIILSTAITAIVVANWINRVYYKSSWKLPAIIFAAFGIFIVLKLITLTPIIGPLLIGIMVCMAFGAILLSLRKSKSSPSL